jgi:exodeoxyribonuclease V alpha subunit
MENIDFLKTLIEKKILWEVDVFFAKNLLKDYESTFSNKIFLSYLFAISRLGHLYLEVDQEIYPSVEIFEDFIEEDISEYIKELKNHLLQGKTIPEGLYDEGVDNPLFKVENKFYLQRNYFFESSIIKNLKIFAKQLPVPIVDGNLFLKKAKLLLEEKILLKKQYESLLSSLTNSLTVISGGPGTGKTYTAKYLVKTFAESFSLSDRKFIVTLAAPTGKATTNLYEKVNCFFAGSEDIILQKMTLHSLLKIRKNKNTSFQKDSINSDLVIVDEASMIDIKIMAYLLESLNKGSRLVLIGDSDQLPPVESGNIFFDLSKNLNSNNVVSLDISKRYGKSIIELAESVKLGDVAKLFSLCSKNENMKMLFNKDGLEEIFAFANKHYNFISNHKFSSDDILKQLSLAKILSCKKVGYLGVNFINEKIYEEFSKRLLIGQYLAIPIIITKNSYSLNLFNGQIGVLITQYNNTKKGNSLLSDIAYFENGISYPSYMLPSFDLAYCLSVHKSQGSEYDDVLLLVPPKSEVLGREVLYTAITRVKNRITIIGQKEVIANTINRHIKRTSGFTKLKLTE